ncbi:MAG: tetratricopeptide repeat protein, partial [Saprospiraceae bacterium]|nr:tetratricopeptide repeat protein [Saprospiraceae bacterium]
MKEIHLLKVLIVLLITISISTEIVAQNIEQQRDSLVKELKKVKIDSNKVKLYEQLFDLYEYVEPNKALGYAKKCLKLSRKSNYYNGEKKAYLNLFNYHYHGGSHSDSLLVYLQKMETVINTAADSANLYYVHGCYGLYYSHTQELEKKIKSNLEALRIIKKFHGKPEVEGLLYHNIASAFSDLGKYKESLRYLKNAYPLRKQLSSRGFTLLDMGNIHYLVYENIDTIQVFYDEAMELFEKDN